MNILLKKNSGYFVKPSSYGDKFVIWNLFYFQILFQLKYL